MAASPPPLLLASLPIKGSIRKQEKKKYLLFHFFSPFLSDVTYGDRCFAPAAAARHRLNLFVYLCLAEREKMAMEFTLGGCLLLLALGSAGKRNNK